MRIDVSFDGPTTDQFDENGTLTYNAGLMAAEVLRAVATDIEQNGYGEEEQVVVIDGRRLAFLVRP